MNLYVSVVPLQRTLQALSNLLAQTEGRYSTREDLTEKRKVLGLVPTYLDDR